MARHELDAKGLLCPLPVLRARKAMRTMVPGDVLAVQATDPNAPKDFVAFCETTGSHLLSCSEDGGVYLIEIELKG